ncbi:hypothetical protein TGP89_238410, partial [Toxoplasma gondii p89]
RAQSTSSCQKGAPLRRDVRRTASLQQPREEDLTQPQASTFLAFEESAGGRRQGKAFLEKERPGRPRESNSVSQGDGAVEDAAKEGRRIEIVNCAFSLHALEAWVPQPSPCCAAAAAVGAWNAVQQLVFSRERSEHGERRQTNRKSEEAGPGEWAESERQARKEEKNGGRKEEVHQTGKEGATGERTGDEDAEKTEAVEVESGERDGNREDKSGEGNGRQVTEEEKENFSRENTGNDRAGTTEEKRDNEEAAESSIGAFPSVSSRSAESVETGLKSLLSDASGARRAMRFRLLSLISSASEMKDRRKREQARKELIQLEEEVLGKLFAAEMETKNEEGRTRQDQQQKTQSEEKEFERRTEEVRVNPKRQKEGEEEEGKTREKKRESGCRRGSTSEATQVKPTEEEKSNTGETDGQEEGKKHWQEKEESEEDNDEGSDEERKNPKGSETGRQQTLECLTVDATDRDTKRKRNKALLVRLLRGSLARFFPSSIDDKDSDNNLSQQLWCRDEKVQTDTGTGADAIFERETPTNESVEIKREWKTSAEILACSTACSRLLGARPRRLSPQGGASEEPAGTQKAAGVSTSEAASWVLERAATKEVSRRKESARRKSVCPSEAETPQDKEGVKEDAPGREEGQGEEVGEGAAERQEEKKGAGEDARTCPEERRLGRVSQEGQGQANEACGVESDGEREAEREEERKAREERDPRTEQGPTRVSGGRVACRRRASSRKRRENKSRYGLAFHRKVMSGLEMLLQRGQAEKRLTFARPSTRHVGNKQLLEAFVAIEKKRHWCRGVARAAERRERSSDEEEPEEQAARQEREGQRRERRGDREVKEAAEREGEEAPHGEKAEGETAAFEGREREKEGKEGDGETESNEETESVEKVLDRDRLVSREDGALSLGGGHDEGVEAKREEKERDEHEWLASTWVCPLCDHGVRAFALMGGPGTRSKWIVERPKRNHERQNREEREKRTELEWIEEQEKRVREEQETQVAKGNWKVLERGLAKEEKEEGVRHNNARRLEMQTERGDSDQEESTTETGDGRAQRRKDEDGRAGTETETEREKTEKVDEEIDEAAKTVCISLPTLSRCLLQTREQSILLVTLIEAFVPQRSMQALA